VSLDALFAKKAASRKSAQDIFTDRTDQARAFADSVRAVRSASAGPGLIADLTAPRRNVLTFYGMGGIGKSTLARELERRFVDGAFGPPEADTVAVSFDFAGGHDREFEELLLRLRSALGGHGRWRAFDIAFASYWERRHPGSPVQSIPDRYSRLRQAGAAWGVGEQLQASVEAVLDGATFGLVGVSRRLGTLAARHMLESGTQRRLLGECPMFEQIVTEPDLDQVLAYLPHLLAWDLHQVQLGRSADRPVDVVVFLDTWEEVQRTSPGRGGLEDLLSRFAYLLPNVLVVVLGRDRLDWAEEHKRATITFAGPGCWPGLVEGQDGEPTQHLLGGLAPADREWFLANCREVGGSPAIPPDVRAEISLASEGLPYYLDLAADYFDDLKAQGVDPEPPHFRVAVPELVGRLLRDLPASERNLLFAASVSASFDRGLLTHLVPQALPSEIDRFLMRHLVQGPSSEWLPYGLHDRLRESVFAYRDAYEGSWSTDRWREARLTAASWIVRTQLDANPAAVESDTRARALVLVAALVAETDVVPDGLPLLVWHAEQAGGLPSLLEVVVRLSGSTSPEVVHIRTACAAAARTATRVSDLLEEVREAQQQARDPQTRDLLRVYLGSIEFILGDLGEAERAYRSVTDATPEFAGVAKRQLAGLLLRRGHFREALAAADDLDHSSPASLAAIDDLRGLIFFYSARFEAAIRSFGAAATEAGEAGVLLWLARSRRHEYLARVWGRVAPGDTLLSEATDLNTMVGDQIGLAQLEAGAAMVAARRRADWRPLIASATARAQAAGAPADLMLVLASEVACCSIEGRVEMARTTHSVLMEEWKRLDTGSLWPIVSALISDVPRGDLPEPHWLDTPEVAEMRWRSAGGGDARRDA